MDSQTKNFLFDAILDNPSIGPLNWSKSIVDQEVL
jgi:hypothetical protein